MIICNFPGCCNAEIIFNFGGTEVTENDKATISKDSIKAYIERQYTSGRCLVATTNTDQKEANEALKELGFKHSKWMRKNLHPETKIRLWWREP